MILDTSWSMNTESYEGDGVACDSQFNARDRAEYIQGGPG